MGLPYDLKNTAWFGYDNPYTPPSEVFYSVNFRVGEYTCTSIGIKNMGSPDGYCLVALPENESTYMILYSGSTFSWLYSNSIEFIDGDDIANVDLLNFMYSSFGFLGDIQGSYWIWPLSETFEDPDGFGRSFEFSAGGTSYYGFYAIDGELTYYPASGGSITAYDSTNGWASDDYKSFIVTDAWQDDENIQDLLTNYMIQVFLPAPDVTISYKGTEIAAMSESGTKTLQTQGKYCEDDITIDYVKPPTPIPNVIYGEFTPDATNQLYDVEIPYTGTGYPIRVSIMIDPPTYMSPSSLINGQDDCFSATKYNINTPPTYSTYGSEDANKANNSTIYKYNNALTFASSPSGSMYMTYRGGSYTVRFSNNVTMSVYVISSATTGGRHGFKSGQTYRYFIEYSV